MPAPIITAPVSPRVIAINKAIPTLSIQATNSPTAYAAAPLPSGISIDPMTGRITGTPSAVGTTTTMIIAANALGESEPAFIIWEVKDAAVGAGLRNDLELDFDLVTREVTIPKVGKQEDDAVITLLTRDALNLLIGFKKWGQLRLVDAENKVARISFSLKEFEPEQIITLTQAVGTIVGSGDTTRYRIPLSITREQWSLLSSYEDDNQTSVRAVGSVELTLVPDDGSDPDEIWRYNQTKTTSIPLIQAEIEPGDLAGTLVFTGIDTTKAPADFTLSMRLVVAGRPNQTLQLDRNFLGRWDGSTWSISELEGASVDSGSAELPWTATLQNLSLTGDSNSIDVAYQITTDGTRLVDFQWLLNSGGTNEVGNLFIENSLVNFGQKTLYLKDENGDLVGSYTFAVDAEGTPAQFFAAFETAWDTITGTTGQIDIAPENVGTFVIGVSGVTRDEMLVREVAFHYDPGNYPPTNEDYVSATELPNYSETSTGVLTTTLLGLQSDNDSVTKSDAVSVSGGMTAGLVGSFQFTGFRTDRSPILFDLSLGIQVSGRPNHSLLLQRTFTATWNGAAWAISGTAGTSSRTSTSTDPWQLTFANTQIAGDTNSVDVNYRITTSATNSNFREFLVDWGGYNAPPWAKPNDPNYGGSPLTLTNPLSFLYMPLTGNSFGPYDQLELRGAQVEGSDPPLYNVVTNYVFPSYNPVSVGDFFDHLVSVFADEGYTVTIEARSATSFAIIYDITEVVPEALTYIAFYSYSPEPLEPTLYLYPQGYIYPTLPTYTTPAVVTATLAGEYLPVPPTPAIRFASQPFFTRVVRDWLEDYYPPTPTPPPPTPTPTPTPTPLTVYTFNFTESRVSPSVSCSAYPTGATDYYSNVETLANGSTLYADAGLTIIANSVPGQISYFSNGVTYWEAGPTGQITLVASCPVPVYTYNLTESRVSPAVACSAYPVGARNYYGLGVTLGTGATLYSNVGLTTIANSVPGEVSYFSDGDTYWEAAPNGQIQLLAPCPVPTPTPDPTPTPNPTGTLEPSLWTCASAGLADSGYGPIISVPIPPGFLNSGQGNLECYDPNAPAPTPTPNPTGSPDPTVTVWYCELREPPLSTEDLGYGFIDVTVPNGFINQGQNIPCYNYPP